MTISVIIVDYGVLERSVQYIDKMNKAIKKEDFSVNYVVVDNYQNYSMRRELETVFGGNLSEVNIDLLCRKCCVVDCEEYSIHFIQNVENGGYAKGNNLGVKYCEKYLKSDFYLFSNNDIILDDNFKIGKLIDCFKKDPQIAIVGPSVIGLDNKLQGPYVKQGWVKGLLLKYIPGKCIKKICNDTLIYNPNREIYWTSGCFLLVDRDDFVQVELFDENTFLYCEEMILAKKLERIGKRYHYCNDVQIVHEAGGTVKKKATNILQIESDINSRVYYYKTYETVPKVIMISIEFILKVAIAIKKRNVWLEK